MSRSTFVFALGGLFLGSLGCKPSNGTAASSEPATSAAERGSAAASVVVGSSASSTSSAQAASSVSATSAVADTPAAAGNLTVGSDPLFKDDAAVVEGFDDGSAAFVVNPDGATKIALANADGKPVEERSAKMVYSITETGKTVEVPLKYDEQHRYLVATGPELAVNVTPVRYEITGGLKPWIGVLQLPAGGTKALNASAQIAAKAHATPLVGPHGGRIERIASDDVELLVDPESGETRAWIIVDGHVAPPKERSFSVVFDDRLVELYPDQNDSFYAKVSFSADFSFRSVHKTSCILGHDGIFSTIVFGFRPHVYVYAPRAVVEIGVVGWTHEKKGKWDKNPNEPGMGWAAGKEKHHGGGSAGVSVDVGIGGGSIGGGAKSHGGGHAEGHGGESHGKGKGKK